MHAYLFDKIRITWVNATMSSIVFQIIKCCKFITYAMISINNFPSIIFLNREIFEQICNDLNHYNKYTMDINLKLGITRRIISIECHMLIICKTII